MWPFAKKPTRSDLQGLKRIKVGPWSYTVRKLNPLMDFQPNKMPQIFSSFVSRRRPEPDGQAGEDKMRRTLEDMYVVVEAGVVEPKLVPVGKGEQRGKEDGMTVEDVFRNPDHGIALYWEIVIHSMNRFRGVKGVFFSMRLRRALSTQLPSVTEDSQAMSPSHQGNSA